MLSGALVWGLMWYPYRVLQEAGVSGELATLLSYTVALVLGLLVVGPVWRELRIAGWWGIALIAAAGWTNFGYVLAVLDGEVMRVLLLFYLAPLWTVLLSRWLLGEKLNCYGYAIVALSLAGAFVMLWNTQRGLPLPEARCLARSHSEPSHPSPHAREDRQLSVRSSSFPSRRWRTSAAGHEWKRH